MAVQLNAGALGSTTRAPFKFGLACDAPGALQAGFVACIAAFFRDLFTAILAPSAGIAAQAALALLVEHGHLKIVACGNAGVIGVIHTGLRFDHAGADKDADQAGQTGLEPIAKGHLTGRASACGGDQTGCAGPDCF